MNASSPPDDLIAALETEYRDRTDDESFRAARDAGTVIALQDYVLSFPAGRNKAEALALVDKLEQQAAFDAGLAAYSANRVEKGLLVESESAAIGLRPILNSALANCGWQTVPPDQYAEMLYPRLNAAGKVTTSVTDGEHYAALSVELTLTSPDKKQIGRESYSARGYSYIGKEEAQAAAGKELQEKLKTGGICQR